MTTKNRNNAPGRRESAAAINETAASWAARVDRGPLSPQDERELKAWVAEDSRRAGAYARALAANRHLDRAQALGSGFAPAAHPVARAIDRRRWLVGGGAAAAAAVMGVLGYGAATQRGLITTRRGDIRRAPLADGSAVTLNTDSALRVRYDESFRKVALLRGEALFDVAKDPARPFVVAAGSVRVRAVGTSFVVRTGLSGAVAVIVREGVVEVWREGRAGAAVRLAAQTRIVATGERPLAVQPLTVAALDRALAWREGFIDLDGMTLDQAAAEFERYSDRRIQIDDPALGQLQVAGRFSAADPDGFARAAALSLGLTAAPAEGGVRLSRDAAR